MSKQKLILLLTLAFAVLGAIASLFISSDATAKESVAFHTLFAISLVVMALHAGAAILLTSKPEAFRARLRTAYLLYCWGFVALGFTFLQTPLLSLLDLWDSVYVESGIVAVPFLAAALLLFFGSRLFAQIIGIKNFWTSFWAATLSAFAVAGLMFVVPHPYVGVDDLSAEGSAAITSLLMVYLLFAAILTLLIKRKTNLSMSRATGWLFLVLVASAVAGLQHTVLGIYLEKDHWYQSYGLSFLPHVIAGLLALKAGYDFSRIDSQDVKVELEAPLGQEAVALNAVLLLASLASRTKDIDPMLDEVRTMTARKRETNIFSEAEQRQLATVFLGIERYLIEQEPLRQFDKATLRSLVRQNFSSTIEVAFWQSIGEVETTPLSPSQTTSAI